MTLYEVILIIYFLMWYWLIALAIFFVISGLDDLFIDLYYWTHYLIRLWKTRKYSPLTYQQLISNPEQLIAVLVSCWNEANVIGVMLQHNCNNIDYQQYYFFVGVYPIDPETVAEVQDIEHKFPCVKCVLSDKPGPTNKAANLNNVYRHVKNFEKKLHRTFDIFVF